VPIRTENLKRQEKRGEAERRTVEEYTRNKDKVSTTVRRVST